MSKRMKYYIFKSALNIVVIFSTGAIIQTFLYNIGLTPKQIGVYTLCISVIQILTLILSFFLTDRIKNISKTSAGFILQSVIFYLIMIYLCLSGKLDNGFIYKLVLSACCFWNFFYGLTIVLNLKLPYYVTDISEFPYIESVSGIILSIIGITVSGLLIFCSKLFGYRNVILAAFTASVIFAVVAALSVYMIKGKESIADTGHVHKIGLHIFKLPQTKYLAIPYFIRGISSGIMNMAAVIMLSCVTKDEALSSSLATVSAIATALTCFVYTRIYKRSRTVTLLVVGGFIEAVSLLFLLSGNPIVFIIIYFIAYAGENIVAYACPIYVTEIVPYEYIGGYSSVRMLLYTAGIAVGNWIAGAMVSERPHLLLLICSASQIIHVLWCKLYDVMSKKKTVRADF